MCSNNDKQHTITMTDGGYTASISFNEVHIDDHVAHCANLLVAMGFTPATVADGFKHWLGEYAGCFDYCGEGQ